MGQVTGFALGWEGQRDGQLWISGDTVLYDGVKDVADRLDVGTAILHLGGVRFPVSGPLRYTMTGAEAVELCALLQSGDRHSRCTTRGGSTSAKERPRCGRPSRATARPT